MVYHCSAFGANALGGTAVSLPWKTLSPALPDRHLSSPSPSAASESQSQSGSVNRRLAIKIPQTWTHGSVRGYTISVNTVRSSSI